MDIYVSRQPIFDSDCNVVAYELLFRNGPQNVFPEIDGGEATSTVLDNAFMGMGLERVIGGRRAFVNFPQSLLTQRLPLLFPKDKIVIEVMEDTESNEHVHAACRELCSNGYTLALDDFSPDSAVSDLLPLAGIVKFDLRRDNWTDILSWKDRLLSSPTEPLAEKVETYEEFYKAREVGFTLFQGFFFSRPEMLTGKGISSAGNLNALQFVAQANKPDTDFKKLEETISNDVALSYKLLRYINSAYFRRKVEVSSVRQSIALLGERGIRQFASLAALSQVSEDKPSELVRNSVIRAKFCEQLGALAGKDDGGELFTLGLFSLIDAILDDSMDNVLSQLPLSSELKSCLIDKSGSLCPYLELAVNYEQGDVNGVERKLADLNVGDSDVTYTYLKAVEWADSVL